MSLYFLNQEPLFSSLVLMLCQTQLHRKIGHLWQLATASLLAFVYRVNSQILSISTRTYIATVWINGGGGESVLLKKRECTVDTINGSEDGSEWTRSLKSRVKLNISGSITHLCSPQYTSCQLSYYHLCSCWLKERKLKIISSLCFMLFDLVFFFFKGRVTSLCCEMSHPCLHHVSVSNTHSESKEGKWSLLLSLSSAENQTRGRSMPRFCGRSLGGTLNYNTRVEI